MSKVLPLLLILLIIVASSGCIKNIEENSSPDTVTKKNVNAKAAASKTPAVTININDKTPPGTVSYITSESSTSWINWSWRNPGDADFKYNNIYINGKFRKNQSQNFFNMTGASSGKAYTISIRTVDMNKNVNTEWVNSTTSTISKLTIKDTSFPGQVNDLKASVGKTWINWTWDNPDDEDFSHTIIYIDGKFKTNVQKTKNYYLLAGLNQNSQRTISIRTADTSKNINLLWTNNTATTTVDTTPPGTVSGLTAMLGTKYIYWTWNNPDDEDFNYVKVYLNGVLKTRTTKDSYNATGLKTNTSYTLSLVTADTSNNINTNWVNSTESTLE